MTNSLRPALVLILMASAGMIEGTNWSYGEPCTIACYDLRVGDLVVFGSGGGGVYYPSSSSLQLTDIYTLGGLPAGGRYTFTVELRVAITTPNSVSMDAGISEPATAATQSFQGVIREPSATRTVSIPLDEAVGTPFTLQYDLGLGGTRESSGPDRAEGHVYFGGLPRGAFITSCQSYDIPVPTRGVSWGTIKAHYR
jgi:hypothetical protein